MVERVDERQGRGAVEGAAVVEGGGDADRGLVGVGDAEVDLTHGGRGPRGWRGWRGDGEDVVVDGGWWMVVEAVMVGRSARGEAGLGRLWGERLGRRGRTREGAGGRLWECAKPWACGSEEGVVDGGRGWKGVCCAVGEVQGQGKRVWRAEAPSSGGLGRGQAWGPTAWRHLLESRCRRRLEGARRW